MSNENTLNQEALNFILNFEKQVEYGKIYEKKELINQFSTSAFHNCKFSSYNKDATGKSIWWALKRSKKWKMIKNGLYKKIYEPTPARCEYIKYLSKNLHEVLMLKKEINDKFLKNYHLSSKGIGEDLYYLTVSYFKQKGIYKGKYHMSDFITTKARKALKAKDPNVKLVYEHMVPKNIYINEISKATLNDSLNIELIYTLLEKYYYVCTVTKDEDELLPSLKMSNSWDEENPFHRYEEAGITFLENY